MSTSSCETALTSNYTTQIANLDADISKRMNVLTTMKAYKLAYYNTKKPGDSFQREKDAINSKYNQGFYIQSSYPGIPQEALNRNGIDGNFYRNNIVVDFKKESCLGKSVDGVTNYCQYVSQARKACCACSPRGKAFDCTL